MTPDGETVIFVGQNEGGDDVLMRRRLDGLEATVIHGNEHASEPAGLPRWQVDHRLNTERRSRRALH